MVRVSCKNSIPSADGYIKIPPVPPPWFHPCYASYHPPSTYSPQHTHLAATQYQPSRNVPQAAPTVLFGPVWTNWLTSRYSITRGSPSRIPRLIYETIRQLVWVNVFHRLYSNIFPSNMHTGLYNATWSLQGGIQWWVECCPRKNNVFKCLFVDVFPSNMRSVKIQDRICLQVECCPEGDPYVLR